MLSPSILYAENLPQKIHTVQVGAYLSVDEAQFALAELRNKGWSPVRIVEVPDSGAHRFKVYFGTFETYADSDWWKRALRRRGYEGAFNVSYQNTQQETMLDPSGPLVPNFTEVSRFGDNANVLSEVVQKLSPELQRQALVLLSEQPERIEANTTQTKTIIAALQPIADGKLAGTQLQVCQARLAISNAFHYSQLRWLTAYHAYKETLKTAFPYSNEEAECLLQLAGLTMELANSSKGDMMEVRNACTLVFRRVKPINERCHSVAHLIYAESLFNEGRFDDSLSSFSQISEMWPSRKREIVAAQVYMGIALVNLKQTTEAVSVLEQVVALDVSHKDFFGWRGADQMPAADAAVWLIRCYQDLNQPDKAEAWEARLEKFKAQMGPKKIITGTPQRDE